MADSMPACPVLVTRRDFLKAGAAAGVVVLAVPDGTYAALQPPVVDLAGLFTIPPDSARPWVLWHWMNGHVTRQGITLDLEAMQRAGVGGVINFDVGTGIPKGSVEYLSQEWFALKAHAVREATRLGLAFGMHNCPGWSSSGGPWITPDLAMQQLTWSVAQVQGGTRVEVPLPLPFRRLDHYRDAVVVAYPSLRGEGSLATLLASAEASSGPIDISALNASDMAAVVVRPASAGGRAWLQCTFRAPYVASALTFIAAGVADGGPSGPEGFGSRNTAMLEASDDGVQFREVARIGMPPGREPAVVSLEFAPVSARVFRLSTPGATSYSQVRFATVAPLEDLGKRTNVEFNATGLKPIADRGADVVAPDQVIDVTAHVDPSGTLRWAAPAGQWTILRCGHTPLGTLNRSAPDTGIGLECDKYRADAVAFHFDRMMTPLLPMLAPLAERGQMWLMVDSYEVGMQNWTPGFEREFHARTGHDVFRYLPAMTGRVVGSAEATERFLWDLRRTQADLMAERYYGTLADLAHRHHLKLVIEPYDRGPMEELQIGARADATAGEFWQGLSSIFQNNLTMRRTPRLAATLAHVTGQGIAGAEAFTGEPESSKWQEHPFGMKARGDENFVAGVNRLMIHTFAHQPHPTAAPGMTMGPWGSHVNRNTTWWEPGRAWMHYLARCQALLQRGLFVADLAYFSGEDPGVYTKLLRDELTPTPPDGYDYDVVNTDVLARARVDGGRIVLPDGMSYRVLVLQPQRTMTLALLRRLRAMVHDGMVLVGPRPVSSPSLRDWSDGGTEHAAVCDELWGRDPQAIVSRGVGKGHVFRGQPLPSVLADLGLARDVEIASQSGDAPVAWIHRAADDAQVYFLANRRRTHERLVCTFRAGALSPELWDPATGQTVAAATYAVDGDRVRVGLELPPSGSVFVVFRAPAGRDPVTAIARDGTEVLATTVFPPRTAERHAGVVDDFAITLWAKPECSVMLSTNNFMEHVKDPWTDQYAIYPSSGEALYGAGHVACGLAIGRNGVAVWERGAGKPVFALAAPAKLEGSTHVALVYRAGVPAVYVGGRFVAKGDRARGPVHPGVGATFLEDGASYFNGDMTTPEVHAGVLEDGRIAALASLPAARADAWPRVVEPAGRSNLRVWANGRFSVRTQRGRVARFAVTRLPAATVVAGPWEVHFPVGSGAPAEVTLPELRSLHLHPTPGVRYFSGTASYRRDLTIPADALAAGRELFLDLGQVEVMAEVVLNGTPLGIVWTRPAMLDISLAARAGANALEVKVTNLWPNRLIGDEREVDDNVFAPGGGGSGFASLSGGAIQSLPAWYREGTPMPAGARVTFATWKHYTKGDPLLESGLIGPVRLRSAMIRKVP